MAELQLDCNQIANNGKTPEEIKKGLEVCSRDDDCNLCPYVQDNCIDRLMRNALAYIQQLEDKLKAYEWYEGEVADENT